MLPYPEPGDAWGTDAIKDLANAVAEGLSAASAIGQVLSVSDNTPFTTASSSYVAVPNISITVTPESADSKFVLFGSVGMGFFDGDNRRNGAASIFRGTTNLALSADSRTPAFTTVREDLNRAVAGRSLVAFDNPSTTSEVTYSIQVARVSTLGTLFVHAGPSNTNDGQHTRVSSVLVVVEVKE
jgi:hypothetical protein